MPRYELNIAHLMGVQGADMYFHYARVTLVSTREEDAVAQSKTFMLLFPTPEWKLTLTKWEEVGRSVEI